MMWTSRRGRRRRSGHDAPLVASAARPATPPLPERAPIAPVAPVAALPELPAVDPAVVTPSRELPESSTLTWRIVAADDTASYPDGMSQLIDRTIDGMTVTGVLSLDEIDRALRALVPVQKTVTSFGALLPMSLGAIGPEHPDRSAYYDDADRARDICREAYGFDFHERLAQVLQPMAGDTPLVAPTEDGRSYSTAQIRWWEPNCGGLPAHVGNEFRRQLETTAMRHLVTVTQVTHHLSYFVVLQNAEEGGSLLVYDLVWEDYDDHDAAWENCQRDDSWFETVPSTRIPLQPGDLIVFGGGWRWHRVEPPTVGTRVTHGGFCAPSVDGSEINFWA